MTVLSSSVPGQSVSEVDRRNRLAKLSVLVADRDQRTASLVQRILFSFGFRNMDITTDGEGALALLRQHSYDILITEWNMRPVDGVRLIKAIRAAKDDARIAHDIPIIMLTAQADMDSVQQARDAGVTEFVVKPFSANTISNRMIEIIDNPRPFVNSVAFTGPDRRRRGVPPKGVAERRDRQQGTITPPSKHLQNQIGGSAADILNAFAIFEAQAELLKAESDFVQWASDDIAQVQQHFRALCAAPQREDIAQALYESVYSIHSQAGIFGYLLGGEVTTMLMQYLRNHTTFSADDLVVVAKHVDTIVIIFKEKMKDNGQPIAIDMLYALKKLSEKLG